MGVLFVLGFVSVFKRCGQGGLVQVSDAVI